MDLAIITVSYNTRDLLQDCLASVLACLERTPSLMASIWVVDNASVDDSVGMVRQRFPGVNLVPSGQNLGFAAANNLAMRLLGFGEPPAGGRNYTVESSDPDGAAMAKPRYVLLLNADTVVEGDALAQLVAFMDENPRTGGCGARLSYADGSFQHGAFRFPGLSQVALDFFPPPGRLNKPLLDARLNGRYSRKLYEEGIPFAVDFVLGATLMVRAAAIDEVGLMDEGYFMYCEEMDWQRRLAAARWPMYCVPSAHIMHYGGASTSQFRGPMMVALWRSRLRYFQRFHGPLFNRLLRALVRLGVDAEVGRAMRRNPSDLAQRLAAYGEIKTLVAESAAGSV